MDIAAILQFVPKLALTLLIINGILIILEVYNIIREDKFQQSQPQQQQQSTDILQPVKFTDETALAMKPSPPPKNRLTLFIPLLIMLIINALVLGISMLKRPTTCEFQQPSPTLTPEIINPDIKIYMIDKNKKWIQLTEEQLSALKAGEEILIAVSTEKPYTKALFKVNGEEILYLKDEQLNPYNEGFISYNIKEGVTEYNIEVFLLK